MTQLIDKSDKIKNDIKKIALELGFCEIGFAAIEPISKDYQNFLNWLESGYQADMKWMEKNPLKRKDPNQILENVKTIITLAYNYNTAINHQSETGKISRYAWGDDYHDILLPKVKQIAQYIKSLSPDIQTRSYVDTGPVLEKIWAARSGIGWQGKNSLILTKKYGSYIFLGVIITTLILEPDNPIKDYCGTCTRCIEACPTGAIVKPKVVDSNKCISYWTIEAKPDKIIPAEISQKLSGWIFGCDICQEVCPWNSKLKFVQNNQSFKPRYGETNLDINKILNMDYDEFLTRFKKSPIKRAKFEGLKKNAKSLI